MFYTLDEECDIVLWSFQITQGNNGTTKIFKNLATNIAAITHQVLVYCSLWSEVVSAMTYGLPPSPPDPPRLVKAGTQSLHLTWEPQPNDQKASNDSTSPSKPILRYQLEMQEGEARQQFKVISDGDVTQFVVEGLRRCSLYRFRLAASNADGMSNWSDVVAFRTAPDIPSAPKGLKV